MRAEAVIPCRMEIVRAMLILKVQNMAFGHSAVAPATVQRLIDMYNADVLPVVYERGSLGASGDLAPLAHLSPAPVGLGRSGGGRQAHAQRASLEETRLETAGTRSERRARVVERHAVHECVRVTAHLESHTVGTTRGCDRRVLTRRLRRSHGTVPSSVHAVRPHPGQAVVAGVCAI
jgi:histidine ammonia-lyase